ncbi:U5 small nuclear ribonucleoprotein 40 kDa protein-like [Panicum miliaceum]|uniref:U5 small nuclear ribonucleoprotein 40 kDa protein-like n=1 Tax=Panicum miliaceum TaxID=4540 RepID=A0A3L6S9G9_PANMI|nr:U5 small nuclear ribonucleoprotein 40 kDa protein-like [Panicum miliaceum]
MGDPPALKRPKLEKDDHDSAYCPRPSANGTAPVPPAASAAASGAPPNDEDEEAMAEEAVVALVAHRERDVERCKLKLLHYQTLLDSAEMKLAEAQARLARYKDRKPPPPPSQREPKPPLRPIQRDPKPSPPPEKKAPAPAPQPAGRPQLVIPGANNRPAPRPEPMPGLKKAAAPPSSSSPVLPPPERSRKEEKKPKRKIEEKEHQNLIPSVKKSSAMVLKFQGGTLVSSQHKRKLRCLELCPSNDQLVVTSALDGLVTLWQVEPRGPSVSFRGKTDCFSPKHRWPEDIAWHPDGDKIFAVYTADNGDSQVSMANLISGQRKVTFLPEKPHTKGIINNITFMPWSDACFVTAGSDHAVILWEDKDDSWKPKRVHKDFHSSAVMGVAGLQQKKTILSVGCDKRIIGFDLSAGRTEFKNLIDSKCMSVLLNPCDFNLYMVQAGAPGRQLRLFDIRLRQTEIHAFGWKQESSESQSALINQSWSPDGWYLSSGSADPVIHIFDIRYHGQNPCQSVQAHQKRVFKAVWHQTLPYLTSISSDLNVGIHKYS